MDTNVAIVETYEAEDGWRWRAKAGIYAAVPSRSFTPTSVTIETQTVVKLGAAAK